MKKPNPNEVLENCKDDIGAKQAVHSKATGQKYFLPSLINLVAAAATKIWNSKENTEQTSLIKSSFNLSLLRKLSVCPRFPKAAMQAREG